MNLFTFLLLWSALVIALAIAVTSWFVWPDVVDRRRQLDEQDAAHRRGFLVTHGNLVDHEELL